MQPASVVINEAARLLLDKGNDKWPRSHLAHAIAFTLREIVGLRPYALSELDTMKLAAGYEQQVPADVVRWLGGVRNMGSDGATPGRTIVDGNWKTLKAFDPDLYGRRPGSEVREVYWDESTPRVFYTYPPVTSQTDVHIQFQGAKAPPDGSTIEQDETTVLPISEDYAATLLDGVMAYALSEQFGPVNERSPNEAQAYANRFYQGLQRDYQVKGRFEPNENQRRSR